MRKYSEITFIGKRKDNLQYVEGNLVKKNIISCVTTKKTDNDYEIFINYFEVLPETIQKFKTTKKRLAFN
jgi:hypothetical protein